MRSGSLLALLLAATFALSPTGSAAEEVHHVWDFQVTLDGKEIGYHRFARRFQDGTERIDIEADFKVKVLFVTAYRYQHRNQEQWQEGCLTRIASSTNDNGDEYVVRGERADGRYRFLRNAAISEYRSGCLQSFAYWDPRILSAQRLLNAQTGRIEDVQIELLGTESFELEAGSVMANRYLLATADRDITLWYETESGRWLGLETLAKGDRVLRYEPRNLPQRSAKTRRAGQTAFEPKQGFAYATPCEYRAT